MGGTPLKIHHTTGFVRFVLDLSKKKDNAELAFRHWRMNPMKDRKELQEFFKNIEDSEGMYSLSDDEAILVYENQATLIAVHTLNRSY